MIVLVFSKDRPMQLDATLRSFARHCGAQPDVRVLYRASTHPMSELYEIVQREHPSVEFVLETDFRIQVIEILNQTRHILFVVDDAIFVRPFPLGRLAVALYADEAIVGVSLRLGKNTTYCYPLGIDQGVPPMVPESDMAAVYSVLYRFSHLGKAGDFGYPLEVSSSLYRSKDVLRWLGVEQICGPFSGPNTLESALATVQTRDQPWLLCFGLSVAFCNPVNVVQSLYPNRAGSNDDYSPESLARRFADGERICIEDFDGYVPRGCHEEVALTFERQAPVSAR